MDREWKVGERVARLNGRGDLLGTALVERVTPSGLPVVGGVTYRKDGDARGRHRWSSSWIKLMTPEYEAELAAELREDAAWRAWSSAASLVSRRTLSPEALERLAAAITAELAKAADE